MKKQSKIKIKSVELIYNEHNSDYKSGSVKLSINCVKQLILSNITDDVAIYDGKTSKGYHCGRFVITILKNKVSWKNLNKIFNYVSLAGVVLEYEDGTSKLYSLPTKWEVYKTKDHHKKYVNTLQTILCDKKTKFKEIAIMVNF